MHHADLRPTKIDWETILTGEMLICDALGKLFYQAPSRELVQNLIDQEVFDELPLANEEPNAIEGSQLLQKWSQEYGKVSPDRDFENLSSDYTHLFIGLGTVIASPWESTYFNHERLLFQAQTLDVREWYRKFGLQAEKLHNEPDDHIGLELAFMAYLSGLALQSLHDQDEDAFKRYLDAQRQFLENHPLKWVFFFCELIEENARTDFYRGLALVSKGLFIELASIYEVGIVAPKDKAR
jgi:putative dimethyl sulfoxide reductase chaperone